MDPNAQLMATIRDQWGAEISRACNASSVPPAFLASLIAGESGGDPNAKRFEPGVLHTFWEILMGRRTSYGSLGRHDFLAYIIPGSLPAIEGDGVTAIFSAAFQLIDSLATSWGLTQIMGYHVLEKWPGIQITDDLLEPSMSLPLSLRLLGAFAHQFNLDLTADFAELFTCWNTGRPDGKTADPEYVPRGLARMGLLS